MTRIFALIILFLPILNACTVSYSPNGAQIGTASTISVQYFGNQASLNNPVLSQVFTEKLKTKFIRETRLKLVDDEGDMQFSGQITGYNVAPVAIQQNVTAARNRLTITINVKFVNKTDKKYDFEKSFTNFEDFDAGASLTSVENSLIDIITEKIIQDVFNEAVINW